MTGVEIELWKLCIQLGVVSVILAVAAWYFLMGVLALITEGGYRVSCWIKDRNLR